MNEPRPIRLYHIAEKAGVTKGTVSKALRGDPTIPALTRERICRLAESMGYRKNALVDAYMANVRAGRAVTYRPPIALLMMRPNQEQWDYDFCRGVQQRCDLLGYDLQTFWPIAEDMSPDRLATMLQTRNIRGIIIGPKNVVLDLPEGHWETLWTRFAVAIFDYTFPSASVPRSVAHKYWNTLTALNQLSGMGYRRVGLVNHRISDQRFFFQFTGAAAAHHAQRPVKERIPALLSTRITRDVFFRWFEKYRPDAVFTGVGQIYAWMEQAGLRIPENVAFAFTPCRSDTQWAGIDEHKEIIGSSCVDLVVGQLHRNETGYSPYPPMTMALGRWVDGPSAPPRSP